MTRRTFFQSFLAGALTSRLLPFTSRAQSAPASSGPFTLPPLPYKPNALEPYIDAETMTLHHDKHHAAYVNNLNKALAPYPDLQKKSLEELLQGLDSLPAEIRTTLRNNAGGHANHSHLWKTLANPAQKPSGKLAKEIDQAFGSYEKWKEEMTRTAMGIFGSGWAWFARGKDGKLFIKPYPNQDSPVMEGATLIYGIDVWEHAYYLKYRNPVA
ncbi:MAG: superoxide dismutase [Verrucomicrobia bacterium]|nr:superoxide dismutase [Verrucomicrobiota bacterium]